MAATKLRAQGARMGSGMSQMGSLGQREGGSASLGQREGHQGGEGGERGERGKRGKRSEGGEGGEGGASAMVTSTGAIFAAQAHVPSRREVHLGGRREGDPRRRRHESHVCGAAEALPEDEVREARCEEALACLDGVRKRDGHEF